MKTDEVCDRPLAPFGFVPSKLQYDIVTYRNEKSTKIKTSAKSQVWECAPEGFQRAPADIRLFSCPLVASAEAKPLRPKANSYAESTSPKAKNRHRASNSLPMAFFITL